MAISFAVIMGFIGASIAMVIGILIFGSITDAINCDEITYEQAKQNCEQATSTAWIVIAILPIALFFVLFNIFGGLGGGDFDGEYPRVTKKNLMEELLGKNKKGMSLKDKRKRSKEKQRLADEEMLRNNNDLVQHSFLTKWLRRK